MKRLRLLTGALSCFALLLPGYAFSQSVQLTISGAGEELSRNIRAHVRLTSLSCDASQSRVSNALPRVRQQIVRAARALGYYQLRHLVSASMVEGCWVINTEIESGEPVTVNSVDIEVLNNEAFFASAVSNAPLQVGQQLNQQSYERIKGQLNSMAVEQGFFDARLIESSLELDLESNTAAATVRFDPGERYRFGAFRIQEQTELDTAFISRYMETESDDYFSSEALLELRRSLDESLYFSRVQIVPLHDQTVDHRVPLDVLLSLRPQHAFTLGGGATTDIGPRLRANYENRYFTPDGHRFTVNSSASPVRQQLDFGYEIPLADPRTQRLSFDLGGMREDVDAFTTRTGKLGASYTFIDSHGWRRDYSLNFQHDEYQLNDDQEETSDLLIPGISFTRTEADDTLYPTRGWRLYGKLHGAQQDILSTESFLQLNVVGKLVHSFGPGRFLLKFEAGTTLVDDVLDLPVSLQYFSGGDQSVRGYKYQSLGPINELGEVTGGKHQLVTGIEYDFGIRPNWKLAVFADAGNAFNDFADMDFKKSAGVGVRWLSPIGPIRVDLASALDNDNKFRIHISMGPDL
ncbi:MAG: autotransporter assembly complex protein TamA [Proteobacteria bacterium]|nr:autotransporter assembly complex protein TamA [Pseudomonadota bacterium]MDA0928757.1 autotransporter assembly complex protein TamA [Pseudomonadota bacterium]